MSHLILKLIEDAVVGEDEKTHKKKVEHMIIGMVKQAND